MNILCVGPKVLVRPRLISRSIHLLVYKAYHGPHQIAQKKCSESQLPQQILENDLGYTP